MRIAMTLFFIWACNLATAQEENRFSNLRFRIIDAAQPVQQLDSLTVMPPLDSLVDAGAGLPIDSSVAVLKGNYLFIDTALLHAKHPGCLKIGVYYRVLPWNLAAPLSRLDTASIRKRINEDAIEFDYSPYEPAKKPWETGGIRSTGAYSRGLSFGNSQNLVFNSNLNLQLDGRLGNDLEVRAALSDNSIPIQPDGTTRQLKEFDRIFIQIKRKKTSLIAGDYDLVRPNGYFSNYFKRLQGAMVESSFNFHRDTAAIRGAAAISKGKFARQNIQGQEGNQGPYRLQGAEGERFIIVLAGTEKVYADGQLLRRGLEDDYVIDYNLGEITFTPRRLITKDVRIIVEFEYAVQTYLRSTAALNANWSAPRSKFYFNLYSEQDARNNGGAQELSSAERSRLAQSGDNLRNAFASGIDTLDAFESDRVLYRLKDTTVCGAQAFILEYSINPDSAKYAARFTEVTKGQGNYVLAQTAANGRVFRWSPPDPLSCQPTGNYEPVVKLIAPELRQLWSVGGHFKPFKNAGVNAEVAMSNRDLNRFSPLGDTDNLGFAGFLRWNQQFQIGAKDKPEWRGETSLNFEQTTRTFQTLNPYRPAEFTRDWNVEAGKDTVAEQIARAGVAVENQRLGGKLRYEFGNFNRKGIYSGQRQLANLNWKKYNWELMAQANYLSTDGASERSVFDRPKIDLSRTLFRKDSSGSSPFLKTGIYFERERNKRISTGSDTLNRMSFWYDLYRLYFQTPDSRKRWQMAGFVSQRKDLIPAGRDFKESSLAREINLNGSWTSLPSARGNNQSLTWAFTLRRLRTDAQANQNTYLGKLDYNLSAFRSAVVFNAGYELGSGQSPKLEFNYLQVNPGEGQFTWVDRNRDSILQVDEMELAVFLDQANYVRVALTTPEYIRTDNVVFTPSLRLEPRSLWGQSEKAWQRTIARFSLQSNLQVNRKTLAGARGVFPWNPLQIDGLNDTVLVTLAAGWRNTLFVNRADPRWDLSLSHGENRSRLAVTTGFEARRNRDISLHGRLNLNNIWSLESDVTSGLNESDNQTFNNRDFSIASVEAGPKVTWLPRRGLRLANVFKWKNSRNSLGAGESAGQFNWTAELTWNPVVKPNAQGFKAGTSLRVKTTYADIRFNGQPNTAVAFSMLEGLQNGKNFIWGLMLDRQISKAVQLSLSYEGRKTGTNGMVHVGRAQVLALF